MLPRQVVVFTAASFPASSVPHPPRAATTAAGFPKGRAALAALMAAGRGYALALGALDHSVFSCRLYSPRWSQRPFPFFLREPVPQTVPGEIQDEVIAAL